MSHTYAKFDGLRPWPMGFRLKLLRKLFDTIIAVFDGAMGLIGFTVLGIHATLKFVFGILLFLFGIGATLSSLTAIWKIVSTGGATLFEGDPMELLGLAITLPCMIAIILWQRWRNGPEPPQHEDMRKRK